MSGTDLVSTETSTPQEFAAPQRAAARLRLGDRFSAVAEVEVTPAGLLAIGGMVGAILLGSAAVIRAARR
ncbi:hypothetical protein Q9Q95_09120 [Sphingomonas sp. DG1-23]|uniref:hypothetical protein n=1 Tax=Sphingomonas sp. DG1-23 TaxID=3068316 RepID=UPI00273E06A6|nr:hypothetical protein [Sphingomonas sp. DG1-23]MDP5279083.1 hypothetical protein [Sphingomonas sp. DG1-23]